MEVYTGLLTFCFLPDLNFIYFLINVVKSKKCKRNPGCAVRRKTWLLPLPGCASLPGRFGQVPARGNVLLPGAKPGPGPDRSVLHCLQSAVVLETGDCSSFQGCRNNGPQTAWLKQQTFILLASGSPKCEIQASAMLAASGGPDGNLSWPLPAPGGRQSLAHRQVAAVSASILKSPFPRGSVVFSVGFLPSPLGLQNLSSLTGTEPRPPSSESLES